MAKHFARWRIDQLLGRRRVACVVDERHDLLEPPASPKSGCCGVLCGFPLSPAAPPLAHGRRIRCRRSKTKTPGPSARLDRASSAFAPFSSLSMCARASLGWRGEGTALSRREDEEAITLDLRVALSSFSSTLARCSGWLVPFCAGARVSLRDRAHGGGAIERLSARHALAP